MRQPYLKYAFLIATLVSACVLFNADRAHAIETIPTYITDIYVNPDSSIKVVEDIGYDFGDAYKHGIYRNIPVSYTNAQGNYNLRVSDISVKDENGTPYKFTVSDTGIYKQIKIGDPATTITAEHHYVITYTVNRAVQFFSDHDELYWNVIGSDWPAQILSASATVHLPSGADPSKIQMRCFAGAQGTTAPCDSAQLGRDSVSFAENQALPTGGVLTIVVGVPKGLIKQPTAWQNALLTLEDNWVLAIPVIVFFVMFFVWRKKGRDPRVSKVVVAEYEAPDGLTPPEIGVIYRGISSNQDVSADIINLAVKGYLKITRIENEGLMNKLSGKSVDYQFNRVKQADGNLQGFEKSLLEDLFAVGPGGDSVKLSDLKQKFYPKMKQIKKSLYDALIAKGYFHANPGTVRGAYVGGGVVVIWLSFAFVSGVSFYAALSGVLSGIIIILFGLAMHERTLKGAQARLKIAGLKLYLSVAEKDRLKFANAPAKNPDHFEKLLPYAMVLAVEKEWAGQFADIYKQAPGWYSDPYYSGNFNTLLFIGSLDTFRSSANATLAMPAGAAGGGSGFGGGGFGGGGFGGGGGGSW